MINPDDATMLTTNVGQHLGLALQWP